MSQLHEAGGWRWLVDMAPDDADHAAHVAMRRAAQRLATAGALKVTRARPVLYADGKKRLAVWLPEHQAPEAARGFPRRDVEPLVLDVLRRLHKDAEREAGRWARAYGTPFGFVPYEVLTSELANASRAGRDLPALRVAVSRAVRRLARRWKGRWKVRLVLDNRGRCTALCVERRNTYKAHGGRS